MNNLIRKKDFFLAIQFGFAAILIALFFDGCMIRKVTGIPCPFCGMTRSMLSLFSLDFYQAFLYHPLFFLFPLYFFVVIKYINEKIYERETFVISSVFVVVYIIRFLWYNIL